MAAYVDNRNEAVDRTIEADLVATAILKLMKQEKQWRSSCERLLSKLEEVSGYSYIKPKTWPLKPNTLSNHIKRVMPALKTKGIEVDFKKSGGARLVIITRQQG